MFKSVEAVKPELLTLADQGLSVPWFISTILLNAISFIYYRLLSLWSLQQMVKNTSQKCN